MGEQTLWGIPVHVDRERWYTANHRCIMSQRQDDGSSVHQCIDCGKWTKGDVMTLAESPCIGDNDLSVDALEIR